MFDTGIGSTVCRNWIKIFIYYMVVIYELEAIRSMIRKPCNVVWEVPFIVNNYREVVSAWIRYRRTGTLHPSIGDSYLLKEIFDFHANPKNHIVLYRSKDLSNCLLMCRIGGKYINILVPVEDDDRSRGSLVATYT